MEKRQTFALFFFIRRTLANSKGEAPIFLRISVNGTHCEMRIRRNVKIDTWSTERGESRGRDKLSKETNAYIDTVRAKMLQIHRKLEIDGATINPQIIKDIFLGKGSDQRTIKQIFEEHNAQIRKLPITEYSPATVRKYEKSLEVLLGYIKQEYNADDMLLCEIDPQFIDNYTIYIKANLKVSHNTAIKRLKHLKKVIRIALANGWITIDPFRFTKLREESVEKEFLLKDEIEKIIAKEITVKRLEQVRDVYLFSVFSGLAFTDVANLRPEHIMRDNNGDMWIRKTREKTDNMCNIPLLDIPLALIDKYKDNPACLEKGV